MENFPESKTSAETIAEYFPTNEKYIREAEKPFCRIVSDNVPFCRIVSDNS